MAPYHHRAIEARITMPYSDGMSRKRALEAAGKLAEIQEEYLKCESDYFRLKNRDMHPVNAQIAVMNLSIAAGEAFSALHKEKEVSTFVFLKWV